MTVKKNERAGCCVNEISEAIQNMARSLQLLERNMITNKGFTMSQCYTVFNLRQFPNISMNELSEKMNLSTSTMTRIVNNLIRDGYIERGYSKEDKRVVLVNLTEKGNQVTDELYDEVMKFYSHIINEIPEGEVLQVVNSINILVKAIEKVKPFCC